MALPQGHQEHPRCVLDGSLHWDFALQLCRGGTEGESSVVVAGGPLAGSTGTWQWKEKAGIF